MDLERLRDISILAEYKITDSNLKKLIDYVLVKIPAEYEDEFPLLIIVEGYTKHGAFVDEGYVKFDAVSLDELSDGDDSIKIGIIAHELAHAFLEHPIAPDDGKGGLKYEDEADKLASDWGFKEEVDALRQKLPAQVED